MTPRASVIIRTKDKADVLPRAINSVRAQSVPAEIVVVDSGSTDGTLELARTYADRVVEIAPADFSFGRALNMGAAAASAPIHVALSAHCWLPRRDWLECALAHYEQASVAAVSGGLVDPEGRALAAPYVLADRRALRPWFGFSNHGSSWRAAVWRELSFDASLEASEDREWMWRALGDRRRFVFDPALIVEPTRVRASNPWHLLTKTRREVRALGLIGALEPLSGADALRQWWQDLPATGRLPRPLYRLHPYRTARIAGRWLGTRDALARATPGRPVDAWFAERPGSPLRLAMFCDRFPELSETFVSGEVRELRRRGAHVTVYSGPPGTRDSSWSDDVPVQALATSVGKRPQTLIRVVRLAVRRPSAVARDVRDGRRWRRAERVTPLRRLAPAIERLRHERTDHIHTHFAAGAALDALRAHRLTGIPFSITAHAYELFQLPANLESKFADAAFVTVPCAYNVRELGRMGLASAKVHVRMLGTDTRAVRRTNPPPHDGPTLAVGRLIEKKGFHVLIEAAVRRDLGPVHIVGDGPWRPRLEELISAHGLQDQVTLAGAVAPGDIRGLMESAGLLVVPSVIAANGDRDALPVVAWEALAMELPVVATSVAGLPEVVRPPWGRIVPPNDPDALAEAVTAWRATPYEERVRAGRAGRAWLERNHRQELAVERLLELVGHEPRADGR